MNSSAGSVSSEVYYQVRSAAAKVTKTGCRQGKCKVLASRFATGVDAYFPLMACRSTTENRWHNYQVC